MGALTFALPAESCPKAKKPRVEVRGGVDVTEVIAAGRLRPCRKRVKSKLRWVASADHDFQEN
eukprot:7091848-Prorocentrum_lima.AAC.1